MTLDHAARIYLGVTFRHQGRNPATGIDCIGLLVCAATDLGLALADFDSTAYGRDPAHGILEGHLIAACGPALPVSAMQAGDIAAIDYKGATRHVGVVGTHPDGGFSLIHTNAAVGHVTEARMDAKWLGRVSGVYRP